ncbi:general substrate transporter [Microdochium trichocladiopsis]|uniref:General substrate transporter n=1 Tax=Microdochium trichocladiopsis TaxID=1682393 RepID=A0A9P9BVR8_9PEZI|nr:general substrate transporter [Microdochium trichocladiopsis]KAH7040032.1 general substrate transporter [Microdochium trichocladiopsis]
MGLNPIAGLTGKALSTLQVALIVAPAFILFGYNQAGIGGLLTLSDWVKTFPEIDTVHATGADKSAKSTLQGFIVATFVVGAIVGSLLCSWAGERFGRRKCIFAAGICCLIGAVLEAASFGLAQFIVGRVLVGIAIGTLSSIVPVWQSETAGSSNRGRHVVLDGLFICVGYVLESWINFGFYQFHDGPVTWRPSIAIGIIFSVVLICSVYLFPESPRWLLLKSRRSEAAHAIAILRGLPEDSMEVQAEIGGIELSLEDSAKSGMKFADMFTMGEDKLLYRFLLCMLLQFYQQMSGSNLISVYVPILFEQNLGMSPQLSKVLAAGAMTFKFLSSFVAFFTIDRFGRRALFITSGAGMCACMVALAITTSMPKDNTAAQIAAGCFIYLFNFFVPIGFLGANFLYCTEVAPLRLRMTMSSLSTANHWLWNFVVIMVTPVAISTIKWQYYIVFAVIAGTVPIAVFLFFPETMGRNLEEIDLLFRDSESIWQTVRLARKRPIAMPQEFARGEGKNGGAEHAEKEEEAIAVQKPQQQ